MEKKEKDDKKTRKCFLNYVLLLASLAKKAFPSPEERFNCWNFWDSNQEPYD